MSVHKLSAEVMDLLAQFRAETPSPREQQLLAVAIDAMLFISSTGQIYDFEDYLKQRESDDPPAVVASFNSREEADAWLLNHPKPPESTRVLIGDQYYTVVYFRERNHRKLLPLPSLDYYIEHLTRDGIPPAVASFNTREEADAWLHAQPEPPSHAFILIAGKPHLTVYHRNVNHRAIYPIPAAKKDDPPAS